MYKLCPKCGQNRIISSYNWKNKGKKRAVYCKYCSREYIKDHYRNNTRYYLDKAHKRNQIIKDEIVNFIGLYLKKHPCVDCGEDDVLVLEFDHKDRTEKLDHVSKLIRGRGSLKKVKNEVKKCQVRCANCHRKKTAYEVNSWRLKFNKMYSIG